MNIPDKLTFAKAQTAKIAVTTTSTVAVRAGQVFDFTSPAYRIEINPAAQTVTVSLPGLPRPILVMGGSSPTPYVDGATQQQIRAALQAALPGIDFSQAEELQPAAAVAAAPAATPVAPAATKPVTVSPAKPAVSAAKAGAAPPAVLSRIVPAASAAASKPAAVDLSRITTQAPAAASAAAAVQPSSGAGPAPATATKATTLASVAKKAD